MGWIPLHPHFPISFTPLELGGPSFQGSGVAQHLFFTELQGVNFALEGMKQSIVAKKYSFGHINL